MMVVSSLQVTLVATYLTQQGCRTVSTELSPSLSPSSSSLSVCCYGMISGSVGMLLALSCVFMA